MIDNSQRIIYPSRKYDENGSDASFKPKQVHLSRQHW